MYLASTNHDLAIAFMVDFTSEINFEDAVKDKQCNNSMKVEMDAHDRNSTWELVDLPFGEKCERPCRKRQVQGPSVGQR